MTCTVVVGGFYGDEGKGKVISYLAWKDRPYAAARGGVGPNAGHTVVVDRRTYKLRQLPSAFVSKNTKLYIGAGVLINPRVLFKEIEETRCKGRVWIDGNCGVIEEKHIEEDRRSRHLSGRVGTTGTGCGPANAERALRTLKIAREVESLKEYIADVALELNEALDSGHDILLEGTQGTFLSLYHTDCYPYCTSKDTTASAVCSDVGIGPRKVTDVILVFKAYTTRVGGGPLEGEIPVEKAKEMGILEIATVTGRVRRAAPFNFKLAKRAVMLNSATQVAITNIDRLYPEAYGVKSFEKLPTKAKAFIETVENELRTPVTMVSTGPSVEDMVDIREEKLSR